MQPGRLNMEWNKLPETIHSSTFGSGYMPECKGKLHPESPTIKQEAGEDRNPIAENDVLCGRGSIVYKHTGNRRYRRIINQNVKLYESCEKNPHKFLLALSIVVAMERQGGRFLKGSAAGKQGSSEWVPISRREAVAKTAQALRDQIQVNRSRSNSTSSQDTKISNHDGVHSRDKYSREQDALHDPLDANEESCDVLDPAKASLDQSKVSLSELAEILLKTVGPSPEDSTFAATRSSLNPTKMDRKAQQLSKASLSTETAHESLLNQLKGSSRHAKDNQKQPCTTDNTDTDGRIWVPKELESLMLSEPDAVNAIVSL